MTQSAVHYWLYPQNRAWTPTKRERERERYQTDPEYRERKLARNREAYARESGIAYNRRLLRMRRNKAMQRMAEREQRRRSGAL